MKKMKWIIPLVTMFLFTACAFKNPLGTKLEGKVSRIEHKSVVGMQVNKIQTSYMVGIGISGLAFNDVPKGLDIEVGDYISKDNPSTLKVIKPNGSKKIYYFGDNNDIVDIKELN